MQPETTQPEPQWKRLKKLNLVGGKFAYLARITLIDRAIAKVFLPLLPPAVTPNAITVFRFISIPVIEAVKDNEILRGLAGLLPDEIEKAWVKNHLRKEVIFLLKNYVSVLE